MKNILIFGFGKSGKSVFDYFINKKVNIFIYDKKFTCNIQSKNNKKIEKNNKKLFYFNNFSLLKNTKYDLCVISPGVNTNCKEIKYLRSIGTKIISELEFGINLCKGKIFCITGTNGKTTTSTLLYEIFKKTKKQCFLCGNIGTPITEIATKTTNKSFIVCEVSSFQLETTNNIKPFATAILNITPDHIDRHKSLKKYIEIKEKINNYYKSKKIFNNFDKNCKKISKTHNNAFCLNKNNFRNNKFYFNNEFILNFEKIKLIGNKNKENVAIATMLAKIAGIKNNYIQEAVYNFSGLEHRIQIIKEFNDIVFIDDSKGTNIDSTLFALNAVKETFNKNITLLLGGSNKNLDFKPIFKQNYFDKVVIYGETKDKILQDIKSFDCDFFVENNFQDACNKAFEITGKNSVVLLSPASASFDEFTGYEMRGNVFQEYVENFCNNNT